MRRPRPLTVALIAGSLYMLMAIAVLSAHEPGEFDQPKECPAACHCDVGGFPCECTPECRCGQGDPFYNFTAEEYKAIEEGRPLPARKGTKPVAAEKTLTAAPPEVGQRPARKAIYLRVQIVEAVQNDRGRSGDYLVRDNQAGGLYQVMNGDEFRRQCFRLSDAGEITEDTVDRFIDRIRIERLGTRTVSATATTVTGFDLTKLASCAETDAFDADEANRVAEARVRAIVWEYLGFARQWGDCGLQGGQGQGQAPVGQAGPELGDDVRYIPVPADKTIKIRGDGDQLVRFLNRYQDSQWPDWRTADIAESTRAQMAEHERRAKEAGETAVYVGDDPGRKAFVDALR